MDLTDKKRRLIEQVVNVFETGKPEGDYANLTIYEDGPNDVRQLTYGRSQTTEYGKLRELIRRYVEAGGMFGEELRPYVDRIGSQPLVDDERFKELLRRAANLDLEMRRTQDAFFADAYFRPAMEWADANGFVLPLSGLVIYDSFIHSGSILPELREKFFEPTPQGGGSEPAWIAAYVKTRHEWLSNHRRPIVRKTTYRTKCLLTEIDRGNWSLELLPLMANGVLVTGD